jgi:hypothetical protein
LTKINAENLITYSKNKLLCRKDIAQCFYSLLELLPSAHLYVDVRQRALKDKLLQKTLIHKGLEVVNFFKKNQLVLKLIHSRYKKQRKDINLYILYFTFLTNNS